MEAIHVVTSVPTYQTIEAISNRLDLDRPIVENTLLELEGMGFVEKKGPKWQVTEKSVHLPKDSLFYSIYQSHWRQKSILSTQKNDSQNLHYTAVIGMSKSDYKKLKQLMLKWIDDSRNIIAPSKEEEIVCMNCDLFVV